MVFSNRNLQENSTLVTLNLLQQDSILVLELLLTFRFVASGNGIYTALSILMVKESSFKL